MGGNKNANQYRPDHSPPAPSHLAQWLEDLRFFDHHLKGVDTGVMDGEPLTYVTMGEEKWKKPAAWPAPSTGSRTWYMAEGGTLRPSVPTSRTGADRYEVDYDATTGTGNIWHTEFAGTDVVYTDSFGSASLHLTYTSEPLETDLEVTGYPVVILYVTSTHADGAFFVYLLDLFPGGEVKYVTEGHLRALHRKVSEDSPPYRTFMPHHTYKRADAMPLVPGQVAELAVGLQPTSVLFRRGHRVRIAIAGHDNDSFARIPPGGEAIAVEVHRNSIHASRVVLPVVAPS